MALLHCTWLDTTTNIFVYIYIYIYMYTLIVSLKSVKKCEALGLDGINVVTIANQ